MKNEKQSSEGAPELVERKTLMFPDEEVKLNVEGKMVQMFSCALQKIDPNTSEEQTDVIVEQWIERFRNSIPITGRAIGKEFGVTRARMGQLKKIVDPKGEMTNWEVLQGIEEYKKIPHLGGRKTGYNEVTLSSLAREFRVSPSLVSQRAKGLRIEDPRNLTETDTKRLKVALLPRKRGRHRRGNKNL